jgi:hypothetical protein
MIIIVFVLTRLPQDQQDKFLSSPRLSMERVKQTVQQS